MDVRPFFSARYLKLHNTIKWKSLVPGFQNGLIYLSSISGSWDIWISNSKIRVFLGENFPLWNFKKLNWPYYVKQI